MNDDAARGAHGVLRYLSDEFALARRLAERAVAQMPAAELAWLPDERSNSVAMLMKHVGGNLRSRFTDFLTTDGEKPDRDRDAEFRNDVVGGRRARQVACRMGVSRGEPREPHAGRPEP